MRIPNFFLVGGGKAGTTSLWFYLNEHPEIYMCPIKEPHYFADKNLLNEHIDVNTIIDTWEEYLKLFKDVKDEKAIGEASTSYIYYADPKKIKDVCPEAKIIITLRNPIERAYSHYLMDVRANLINPYKMTFIDAVRKMPMFTKLGFFYDRVKKYIEVFGKNKVLIILYDDLKVNTSLVVKNIFNFLEVNAEFVPKIEKKYNTFSITKNRISFMIVSNDTLRKTIEGILPAHVVGNFKKLAKRLLINNKKPKMEFEALDFLKKLYSEDISKLQDLIEKDLTDWLDIAPKAGER